ncbi:MAG: HNH endonuclease [Acidobacteria bacterium]|nr:HNH endonuclease [Acidobacteriota bacterium]
MPKHGQVLRQLVQLGETPDACWQWLGRVSPATGYGKKQFHGRTMLAHRWMYEQLFGPIPEGLVINHKCRNRSCVNPHHLEVTTQAGNTRHGAGTILTAEQVREIKAAFSTRKWGEGRRLARRFGVSNALIHDIWHGRAWKEIA